MEFDDRLQKAIERGQQRGQQRASAAAQQALNEEEARRLHTRYRLELSEHIELCIKKLPDHFPGFRYENVVGDRGWGAAVSRDDLRISADGQRKNLFSRLEMTIRPLSSYQVIELTARGTVANRELFSRSHYQKLLEVDTANFRHLIDVWIIEFAEQYAAQK